MTDQSKLNLKAERDFEPYGATNQATTNPVDTQGSSKSAPGQPLQPSSITGDERLQTSNAQPIRDPLIETDPLRVPAKHSPAPPLSIGRSDLDPFRFDPTGTGGMIFDPFHNMPRRDIPTNLPPGAVPPGARFDPFGPPNPDDLMRGSRVGPNPSHLRKPDFDGFGGGGPFM